MVVFLCWCGGVFVKNFFYRRSVMRTARFQLGWKGAHAEPWVLCMVVGAVPASGRRSDIVSDLVPNNLITMVSKSPK